MHPGFQWGSHSETFVKVRVEKDSVCIGKALVLKTVSYCGLCVCVSLGSI